MKTATRKIVVSSIFTVLCCVATMIIKIPSLLKGYLNLGDCVVLTAGFILPPVYAFLAAGIGSSLADIFSGYIIYAPITFIIKGVMAFTVAYGYKYLKRICNNTPARIICGAIAELEMVLGYFLFEGFMYGFAPSVINIIPNAIQGITGLIISLVLIKMFDKKKIIL